MGAPGNQISEFGTVYGNFFSGILGQFGRHSGQNLRPDSSRVVFGISSGFLRGFFGVSSGNPEAFPNTSRTLPEENRPRTRKYTGKGPETIFPPVKGGNGKEKNFRIRYRTLKSGPG
jgi:hypothetical protein